MKSSTNNSVQAFYDQTGKYFSQTRRWLWPEMLPYLNIIKQNDTVLDIGCGNGRLLEGIQNEVTYIGVDFSSALLLAAKKLHPLSTFIQADILESEIWQNLPQANALFCVAVLHHIPQEKLNFLFKQFSSHLKKGGFVYISSWNLLQKKYLSHHFSLRSIISKLKHRNLRSVMIPFQKIHYRSCQSYLHNDFISIAQKNDLKLDTAFFSGGTSYFSGRNIVQVYRKV